MTMRRSFARHRRRVVADTRAASAVEYGLIAALIVLTMMVALSSVADVTTTMWNNVSRQVMNAH